MSRIITPADLQGRNLSELQALYQAVHDELMRSAPGSQARRQALASLEAVSFAIARLRSLGGPRP
jgi:hypothetical protein